MISFESHELATRILVVENVAHMARIIREMMAAMGFEHVHRVTNVIHAYQHVVEHRPGLIIAEMDIVPVGGGQFCRALRCAGDSPDRRVPVLLTLTHATTQAVAFARDVGAHFVLAKPLSTVGLAAKIASVLRDRRPFVGTSSYTGPDRRRRDLPLFDAERRRDTHQPASYVHPAHQLMKVDPDLLAGKVRLPAAFGGEDIERTLRVGPRPAGGVERKVMMSWLLPGMELAESVTGADGSVLAPCGAVLNDRLIGFLRKLADQGRIGPDVHVLA